MITLEAMPNLGIVDRKLTFPCKRTGLLASYIGLAETS